MHSASKFNFTVPFITAFISISSIVRLPVCMVELSSGNGGAIGMSGGSNEGIDIGTGAVGTTGANGAEGVGTVGATGPKAGGVGAVGRVGVGTTGANGTATGVVGEEAIGGSGTVTIGVGSSGVVTNEGIDCGTGASEIGAPGGDNSTF